MNNVDHMYITRVLALNKQVWPSQKGMVLLLQKTHKSILLNFKLDKINQWKMNRKKLPHIRWLVNSVTNKVVGMKKTHETSTYIEIPFGF